MSSETPATHLARLQTAYPAWRITRNIPGAAPPGSPPWSARPAGGSERRPWLHWKQHSWARYQPQEVSGSEDT